MTKLPIKIACTERGADLPFPAYARTGDAGMDLHAAASVVLHPGCWGLVPCGIRAAIPPGYVGMVCPRSGLALKAGVTVLNGPGIIDAGYRGEVSVVLINHNAQTFRACRGERIAQLVVVPVVRVEWDEVDDLESTTRGEGGFGSSGQ